jgi:hypothetical protein
MGSKLDIRNWLLASAAVFILYSILQFIVQAVFLMPTFPEVFPAAPAVQDIGLVQTYTYIGRAVFALIFVYIFTRGFEGKAGIFEGIRYGFWIAMLIQVPAVFAGLVVLNQPAGILVGSAVSGTIQYILCGILTNMIYRKPKAA